MSSWEENDRLPHSGPRSDLESPFLAEELFAGEAGPEWEARLAVLEAESPFQSAFEEGDAAPYGPVEPEEEFVGKEWGAAEGFSPLEGEAYDELALAELEENRELCYEEEAPFEEGETDEEKPLPRMKFELQTSNRIWRNDGTTASLLERKYGPDDFLVDKKGVRLESETNGVLEFETEWFSSWTKLEEAINKAAKMTDNINGAAASKFEKSRKAFPFSVDHLRKGSTKELRQGFWDRKPGMEGEKEKILRSGEELEVEITDASWEAGIQSSESFLLEYYESFLRQHEWPFYRDGTIKHAKAVLDGANTVGMTATEVAKLRSFLQIIINYIMRGQGGAESDKAGAFSDVEGMPAKQAFTLMSRTNFASMHKVLLTGKERKLFEKIVKNDAVLKEMGLDRKSPLFIKGYGTKHHEPGPTVYQWLAGIAKGVDLLSARSGKSLSAAMGRYNVETRKGKKDQWLVKFETRNTVLGAVGIKAKDWVTYAQKLFDTAGKRESDALDLAQKLGITDENKLTNFIFHARHPELEGRRIRESERALAKEWLQIRNELVRGVQPELEEFEGTGETFEDFHDAEFVDDEPEEFPEALYGETGLEEAEEAGYADYETEDDEYPVETEGAWEEGFSLPVPFFPAKPGGVAVSSPHTPVPLFPPRPDDPLAADPKMAHALRHAIAAFEKDRKLAPGTFPVRITVVDVTNASGPLPSAGHFETETDYIASEAKVAVMYAAYALRDMVRRFAATTGANPTNLSAWLATQMDPSIAKASDNIARSLLMDAHRVPSYRNVFEPKPASLGLRATVAFSPAFERALEGMIVPSNNAHAAACVHGVGYGYLNGALAAGGFFDPSTSQGLWVAGDFQEGKKWPYVRIVSRNDGLVAQAGTTRDMAKLVSLIMTDRLLDPASCAEMRGRLARAAKGIDTPWVARTGVFKPGTITHNKLGLGPLKSRKIVRSEVSVYQSPVAKGRRYVVAWQNLVEVRPIGFADIAKIIKATITEFER
ncbi:hypothetical protein [Geobacter sp.]|uniref:hypothetical protein n=1 Tax=Geobacter sp. TaxID=46610 RepID=UPI0027B9AB9F|nr:hypothetical protein [Geobacter sp.]